MPLDLTQTNEILPWASEEGMYVTPADIANLVANIDTAAGLLVGALGGPNFIPAISPATVVPGTGMQVIAGGAGQRLIVQGRLLDVCPATNVNLSAAGVADRMDLIAVQASRVAGATNVTRNVRADAAPAQTVVLSGTLVAGTVTIALPATYPTPPDCFPASPTSGTGVLSAVVSGTNVIVTSTNGSDTRAVKVQVIGNPTGSTGAPTTITMLENRPVWAYIPGSSTSVPSPPPGYEAFASVYVHASETSVSSADITYLFPVIPALSLSLVLNALTAANVTVGTLLDVDGNAQVDGTLGVTGAATLHALTAAATVLASLHVTGGSTFDGAIALLGGGVGPKSTDGLTIPDGATGATNIGVHATQAVASIVANALKIFNSTTNKNLLALDTNGDLGITGAFNGAGTGLTGVPTSSLTIPPLLSITSTDGSATVTPASGTADISVSHVGQVVKNVGTGTAGSGSVTVALPTLPGGSSATYKIVLTEVFGGTGGGTTESFAFAGTVGNSTGSDTNSGFSYAQHTETAHGGQAPSVTVTGSGAVSGGPVIIVLEAIRQ